MNNIVTSCGKYGYQGTQASQNPLFANNADYNNTTAAYNTLTLGANVFLPQALATLPYVGAGGGNFALTSGNVCRALGLPAAIPPGLTATDNDLGAAQAAATGGSQIVMTYRRKVR